jgi:hypothetical protein
MRRFSLLALAFCFACSSETEEPLSAADAATGSDASASSDASIEDDAAVADAGVLEPDSGAAPIEQHAFCDHLRGPASGTDVPAVDLSVAHAEMRFFSAELDYETVDRAFAEALAEEEALLLTGIEATLYRFVAPLRSACVVTADDAPLENASVRMNGYVAIVRPGIGEVELPTNADLIALDLRDLPSTPELNDALARAANVVLTSSLDGASKTARRHLGLRDEVVSRTNIYDVDLVDHTVTYAGSSVTGAPLVVLTGERMAPAVARFAGALRLAARARVIGADIHSAVAESDVHAIGAHALGYRTADLYFGTARWPDVIPADVPAEDAELALATLDLEAPIEPLGRLAADRAVLAVPPANVTPWPSNFSRGYARASLLSLHGAMRLFFPYFPVVGDRIDDRLLELLPRFDPDPVDGVVVDRTIRAFTHVLDDGHSAVYDFHNARGITTSFPLILDQLDGEVVVRAAHEELIPRGSKLLRFNERPVSEVIDEWLERVSASTIGHRWALASGRLQTAAGPITFEFEKPDGTIDTLTVTGTRTAARELFAPATRPSSRLADLGHEDVLFVNMDDINGGADFHRTLTSTAPINAAVIDMRGYPGFNFADVLQRIIDEMVWSSWFRIPLYEGPGALSINESRWPAAPSLLRRFTGPAVLLVSHRSVSAAETFSSILVQNERVTVVGRRSAGTNGNLTGMQLPSGFGVTFTGMEVVNEDRSTFHGVGIIPDVVVQPTRADVAAGRDVELEAALKVLGY